jgi:hypothetical protein
VQLLQMPWTLPMWVLQLHPPTHEYLPVRWGLVRSFRPLEKTGEMATVLCDTRIAPTVSSVYPVPV